MKEAVEELLGVTGIMVQALDHIVQSSPAHRGLVPLIAQVKGRLRVARFILNRTDTPPDEPPSDYPGIPEKPGTTPPQRSSPQHDRS